MSLNNSFCHNKTITKLQSVNPAFYKQNLYYVHIADSFLDTNLEEMLSSYGITDLLVCGMMTQNCVTHTAISKTAEKYRVSILADCCTTVDATIHGIALNAVAHRVSIQPTEKPSDDSVSCLLDLPLIPPYK